MCRQAVFTLANGAERLAMNAARRAPRAQGMHTSVDAAAAVTDLMNRLFVFMICSLLSIGT
jgi:hypothetical protein